ncbi:prepilin-type N-terminal cleavage/methylation domain-containing protein [Candidatus Peregrinibacteria bacterium]|jgi:prepilin-type N-terminal cleavage/methylation domain-containing protein|nr:prepilin-type N-terminal cleavage/methylation domain-containing protein [Candidatus Peregrinibacteria bacterium]MBT3598278.1 prepilin-type N-terminal cleavage/methylation domain-containing protein [Candidatus Peregrinibacteria bacterium]MBT4367167.1 prepilin-type N-terminal cleavage/methylation domain-containing protein [Candidatus Peregrinibacteria bacterium]MBT4585310.1 prepilin-type N-terminal cleavage/methylation domain-containing protein [Candidatus Peregrinibacteria bacterium]MBT673104
MKKTEFHRQMLSTHSYSNGFTLIELLLAIGIISILMAIIIGAINPSKQYRDAQNADRTYTIRMYEHAISQYLIDGNAINDVPARIGIAKPICQDLVTGTDCTVTAEGFDLSALIAGAKYAPSLPVDPALTGSTITGYYIFKDGSFIRICSPLADPDCGNEL